MSEADYSALGNPRANVPCGDINPFFVEMERSRTAFEAALLGVAAAGFSVDVNYLDSPRPQVNATAIWSCVTQKGRF